MDEEHFVPVKSEIEIGNELSSNTKEIKEDPVNNNTKETNEDLSLNNSEIKQDVSFSNEEINEEDENFANSSCQAEDSVFINVEPKIIITDKQKGTCKVRRLLFCDHSECEFTAKSGKDLKRHKESVHLEIPSGNLEVKIAAAKARGIHAEVGADGRLYYHCSYCDYVSVRSDTIKSHIDRKHLLLRPYPATKPHHKKDKMCDQCNYATEKAYSLKRHKEKVHGSSREELEERLREATSLGIPAVEGEDGTLVYFCTVCEHRAKNLMTATRHRERKHFQEETMEPRVGVAQLW